jgi:hypothetical protein
MGARFVAPKLPVLELWHYPLSGDVAPTLCASIRDFLRIMIPLTLSLQYVFPTFCAYDLENVSLYIEQLAAISQPTVWEMWEPRCLTGL